jgi:formate/nitrite transporter FocA (FNT family)
VALTTANAKSSLAFIPAVGLGIMCNALVCLAVWMCDSARTTIDRVVTIIAPIAAFVAAGFEHSIANVYFIPMGLFIKLGAPSAFWASNGKTAADFSALTWTNFFIGNLLPVTIGNIIGGSIIVAAVFGSYICARRILEHGHGFFAAQLTAHGPEGSKEAH